MRFVSFVEGERHSYGVVTERGVLDLQTAARCRFPQTLNEFIPFGAGGLEDALEALATTPTDDLLAPDAIRLCAPIPRPRKNIFCVGRNYREHVAEGFRAAGREIELPSHPQFFTKAPTSVMSPEGEFRWDPAVTQKLDYEVELAVVIGRAGRDIAREDAMSHIFGVTVLNDITARDLQRRHDQWFKGKSLDGSAPMGPCLVTLDDIADLGSLELTTRVNGEPRQHARVSQMIFDIPELIAQLSSGMSLEPGDIIATGTPSGVGYAMEPARFLRHGDVVECAVGGIGQIRTTITQTGRVK